MSHAELRESTGTTPAGSRPHIVFVIYGLSMGGAESQLTSLLEAGAHYLASHRVTLLTMATTDDAALRQRLARLDVTIDLVRRGGRSFPAFFVALVRWFRRERPDIAHTLLAGTAGTWGRLAARLAGVPGVIHSELSLAPTRTIWQRSMEPLANRLTDRFFPNAHAIAERLVSEGVRRDRIRVIRNGVDLLRFSVTAEPVFRSVWGVAHGAVVAGYLGGLRPVKRPGLLLDAILALPESDRPQLVVFAGDGDLMPVLRARVQADPWLREHVQFMGLVIDTPGFLASIDYLVLPSDTEGLPNVIVEAMAVGVPCIATRVSDVPDLVTDNGFLVDPGDAVGLAEAMRSMHRLRAEERKALGLRGRERANEEFGLDRAAELFWASHLELLSRVRHA